MRFWIREANGRMHDGVNIQGSGGILTGRDAAQRLRAKIRLAGEGRDTGLYEPSPGHALGFYDKWWGRAEPREIDLRGATIEHAEDAPLPDIAPPIDWRLP